MLEYIKYQQKQLEKKRRRAAEVEAIKEAKKEAEMEAEARMQEESAARKKLLLEQEEAERLRQKQTQRKEKLTEQKWSKQLDTLLAQVDLHRREDDELEEIRVIIQNREPSLQEFNWASWLLADPLNQELAALDFERAMEMFKRDNLMAKLRKRTGGHVRKNAPNYALAFTGDTAASATENYVTTDFNPDDYDLNLGFTVSYWVRPDEVGTHMFAFGRKYSNSERFTFGIDNKARMYVGAGNVKMTCTWDTNCDDNASGLPAAQLFPSLFDDGDLKTGNWLHFAVTYADRESTSEGGVARKTYLNGELIQQANLNWSSTGGVMDGGLYFGGRSLRGSGTSTSYNNGWACAVSQVAIFDTAKDANWVTSVYNADRNKLDLSGQSGLVGYWKFDKGGGTIVTDYSGNGNHGTFAPISGDTTAYPTWEKV